jgi:hypothetical protein
VLGRVLDELDRYRDDAERSFADWLDEVVDRCAADELAG